MNECVRSFLALSIFIGLMGCSKSQTPKQGPTPFLGFPEPPPIAEADPSRRTPEEFEVPTALAVYRSDSGAMITFDTFTFATAKVDVGYKMATGAFVRIYKIVNGKRQLVTSGLCSNINWGLKHGWSLESFPASRPEYDVEIEVIIFETDIPSQHLWSPYNKKYKVLWTKIFKSPVI